MSDKISNKMKSLMEFESKETDIKLAGECRGKEHVIMPLAAYHALLNEKIIYKTTLKTCIDLLKQEGSDTKQQVLEKLEELVK